MAKFFADLFGLSPIGGSVKFNSEVGLIHWHDRFGRHWVRSNRKWYRADGIQKP